jgi:hypothetical protein
MTAKLKKRNTRTKAMPRKKTERRKAWPRREELIELRASVEDDLLSQAEEAGHAEARWNRPRKQRISLRVDTEVNRLVQVDGSGLPDANEPHIEKSHDGG